MGFYFLFPFFTASDRVERFDLLNKFLVGIVHLAIAGGPPHLMIWGGGLGMAEYANNDTWLVHDIWDACIAAVPNKGSTSGPL